MSNIVMEQEIGDIIIEVECFEDLYYDASYLEQEGFEDRLAAFKAGEFGFIGLGAFANIEVKGVIQKITSGGLYGIENDSNQEYLDEIAKEQIDELRDILKALALIP